MSDTADQIATHIRDTRDDLSANLSELEDKVKSVTDWRQQYQKHPGAFLAVAAGAGFVAGTPDAWTRVHSGSRDSRASSAATAPEAQSQRR